jgi:histidyl-tRNA synthetase
MSIQQPTGVFDILPSCPDDLWREVHLWQYVEGVCRQVAADYGLSEIRTPIFERSELFKRSVGEETDIVAKEMYVFEDRGGRELALRPEGTASVIRSLVCGGRFSPVTALRYFYIGPMFRYERPQAGRFRQHHQFGVEVYGIRAPEADAEIIALLTQLYRRLGLPHLKAFINSLGDPGCRASFKEALLAYLAAHLNKLSEDSQRRFERNPLRILDSKDPGDQEILKQAPSILDFLSTEDKAHFNRVQELLTALEIPFEVNPLLVRGLDYYQRTVFEITSGKLGSQNTVGGGGRYDGLLARLGGPDLPCIGFGTGLERIIQLLIKENLSDRAPKSPVTLVILPLDEKAKMFALQLAEPLRERSVRCLIDYSEKKVKQSVAQAAEIGAEWLLVLGDRELETRRGTLKYLQDGSKTEINLEQIDVLVHLLHFRHAKEQ